MKTITEAEALRLAMRDLSLEGRRILSFDVVGRLWGLDRIAMRNCYNICIAPEGGPYKKSGNPIFEDEIPLDLKRTRMFSTDGPFIMELDDGRAIEICIPDYSQATVRARRARMREKNACVDASRIMAPLIGERISGVSVSELPAEGYERQYLDEGSFPQPFKYIRIDCEAHSLYLSYLTYVALRNADGPDPLAMTMGELKDSISYYDELFDRRNGGEEGGASGEADGCLI